MSFVLFVQRDNRLNSLVDLVFGGRIMKEDKTPKEYKVISGSTVFMLKKQLVRGECSNFW